MAWHGILGHDDVAARFRLALERGRLASSFLFVGPQGIGKRRFAFGLSQVLLCSVRPEAAMDPCGTCPSCVQVRSLTHPDLEYVRKPDDKAFLPLELLIGDKEHRGRAGLCHRLALKPFMGGRKVAIIDDADYLNPEGANSLLKTLEEPPPRSVLILIGTSPAKQLPTIRSRCQLVRFQPLAARLVGDILRSEGITEQGEEAERLAAHSAGSVQRATELADPDVWEFRRILCEAFAAPTIDCVGLASEVLKFIEQSGREGAARRERLRQAIGVAGEFYEQLLRRLTGVAAEEQDALRLWVDKAAAHWRAGVRAAAACVERCLEAADQVERNAYPATLVETWLDDLARQTLPAVPPRG
jgi:DNA polymerase-3 subunit delta'